MLKRLAATLLLSAAATVAAADLSVHASWYRPHTNTAYLYLVNPTDKPLTINKLLIDGVEESAQPWPLKPDRKAHWFDAVPSLGISQVRINLRKLATKPFSIQLETSAGPVKATITPAAPKVTFSDITFSKDGTAASLFLQNATSPISQVFLDGRDITKECDLTAAAPHQGASAAFYKAKSPLARGSYHTWELLTADQQRAIYTIRTNTNDFILGTYGNPNFQVYKDASLNHYISFGRLPANKIDELGQLGMTGGPVPFVGAHVDAKTKEYKPIDEAATRNNLESLKSNPALAYYSAPDEPDGADHPLGVGTHARSIIQMRQVAYQVDPSTPTFVQIDNTYRPHNYHVYAEAMDYSSTHRYNLGQDFLEEDRGAMQQLRSSTSPQPYLWVTQLYPVREKEGERVAYNGRHPLPQEMHIQMLEALAGGNKGLIHYIHSGSRGGRGGSGLDASLWSSMPPFHQQVAAVGPVATQSTPVNWARSSDPRVHAQVLFKDPRNLLLVLTNNAIQSTKTDCTVPTITGATISLSLPSWCKVTRITEVLPGGKTQPATFKQINNDLTLQPASLNVGTIYWLQGDSK